MGKNCLIRYTTNTLLSTACFQWRHILLLLLNERIFTMLKVLFLWPPLFFSIEFCLAYSKDWTRKFMWDGFVNIFKKIRHLLCVRTAARVCRRNSKLLPIISVKHWIEVCVNQKVMQLASLTSAFCLFFFSIWGQIMSCDKNCTLNYMLLMSTSPY